MKFLQFISYVDENNLPLNPRMLRDKCLIYDYFITNTNNINYKITTDVFISLNNESYR